MFAARKDDTIIDIEVFNIKTLLLWYIVNYIKIKIFDSKFLNFIDNMLKFSVFVWLKLIC